MAEKMSEVIKVRVTPSLKKALEAQAERLNVRPADVQRWGLAWAANDLVRKGRPTAQAGG